MLIRPNEPRGNWNIYIAGFGIAHLFPPAYAYYDHTEYARMLLWTPARSEASSYNRLIEDMDSDGRLVGPFVAVACAVADLDLKRERSLAYVGELVGRRDRQCVSAASGKTVWSPPGCIARCIGGSRRTAMRWSGS